MSCPARSAENVTRNTSCEKALLLSWVFSFLQSQTVNMKSGSPPTEANSLPSGLEIKYTGMFYQIFPLFQVQVFVNRPQILWGLCIWNLICFPPPLQNICSTTSAVKWPWDLGNWHCPRKVCELCWTYGVFRGHMIERLNQYDRFMSKTLFQEKSKTSLGFFSRSYLKLMNEYCSCVPPLRIL